jgi:hypothetical protein
MVELKGAFFFLSHLLLILPKFDDNLFIVCPGKMVAW